MKAADALNCFGHFEIGEIFAATHCTAIYSSQQGAATDIFHQVGGL